MSAAYEGWARLELMGHRIRVGRVSEAEMYGGKLIRIDIPVGAEVAGEGAEFVTEYYGCSSVYALAPISEQIARSWAQRNGDFRPARPLDYRLEDRRPTVDDEDQTGLDEEPVF